MANKKPNVLLIVADDVGWFNIGAYNRGMMGTPTLNIDRICNGSDIFPTLELAVSRPTEVEKV